MAAASIWLSSTARGDSSADGWREPGPSATIRLQSMHCGCRPRGTVSSDCRGRRDLAGLDGRHVRRVICRVDVGIGLREVGDGAVEYVARAEVRRDGDRIAGPGVGPCQGPAAEAAIEAEAESAGASSCRRNPSCPTAGGGRSRGHPDHASSRGRCPRSPASAAGRPRRAGRGCGAGRRRGTAP